MFSLCFHDSVVQILSTWSRTCLWISCRLQFYSVDVNTVSHKLVARAGVTVSWFSLSYYFHHFSFSFSMYACYHFCNISVSLLQTHMVMSCVFFSNTHFIYVVTCLFLQRSHLNFINIWLDNGKSFQPKRKLIVYWMTNIKRREFSISGFFFNKGFPL